LTLEKTITTYYAVGIKFTPRTKELTLKQLYYTPKSVNLFYERYLIKM